ncbi:MAG: hypothetical protein U0353_19945 [Sandaracinus sp.]
MTSSQRAPGVRVVGAIVRGSFAMGSFAMGSLVTGSLLTGSLVTGSLVTGSFVIGCGSTPSIVCGDLGAPCCGATAERCQAGLLCLPEGGMEVCRRVGPDAGLDAPSSAADAFVPVDAFTPLPVDAFSPPPVDSGLDAFTSVTDAAPSTLPCTASCDGVVPPIADVPTTGLVLWLRADRGVRVGGDSRVCSWCDLSGEHHDMTPVSSGPLWSRTALSGRPGVTLEAAGEILERPDVLGIAPAAGRTMFVVVALTDAAARSCPLAQLERVSDRAWVGIDPNTWATAGGRFGVYYGGNSFDATTATDLLPHVHALAVDTLETGLSAGGVGHFELDGVAMTIAQTAGDGLLTDFSRADVTSIGCLTPHMTIAEVVVYARVLDAAERRTVSRALASRSGVTIAP